MFIHPAGLQDPLRNVPLIGSSLRPTFGILMVTWEHLERYWYPISPPIGTESVPDSSMDSIINYIQARKGNKSHRPTT